MAGSDDENDEDEEEDDDDEEEEDARRWPIGWLHLRTSCCTSWCSALPQRISCRALTRSLSDWRKTHVRRTVAKRASRQNTDWNASALHSPGQKGTGAR